MIRRVSVDGYKSLKRVELELRPLTVILGPNAAGKSNLFDALHLLSQIVTSRSLADAFRGHRGDPLEAFDYSETGIAGLLDKEEAHFTIEVDTELSEQTIQRAERLIQTHRATVGQGDHRGKARKVTEPFLRYRITVAITPRTGLLHVMDERLEALTRSADGSLRPDQKRRPFLERVDGRLRLRMEGQARPVEYETGLTYAVTSQPVHPPHYPHLIAFREEVSRWQFYYFEPCLMREESPLKDINYISHSGGDMAAFYYTLKRANPGQFDNVRRTLQMLVPSLEGVDAELTPEGKVRLKIKERGVEFSAKVISEGTLRLLGLMAILNPVNPATVVGFEEPENGVHPRRLKLIGDLLSNASAHRQVIVNTHSPLLPGYLENAYLVQCRKNDDGHSEFLPLSDLYSSVPQPELAKAFGEPVPQSRPSLEEKERVVRPEKVPEEPVPLWQRIVRGDLE